MMKCYQMMQVNGEPDWLAIPILSLDCHYLQTPEDNRAYAQVCWNADAILLHLWSEGTSFRAEETGPLGRPCEDSCLEFFFCPMEKDSRYFNIEFNYNKCLYLGFGSSLQNLVRLIPDEAEACFTPCTRHTEKGWEIFYRIPFSFIRRFFPEFQVYPGKEIRANCYACADLAEQPYHMSWSPISGVPLTFHRPDCFGWMQF